MKIGTIGIKFTRPFWGGLLIGVSVGRMLGWFLADQKLDVDHKILTALATVLVVLGIFLAKRAPNDT